MTRPASRPDLILLVDSHWGQYVPQCFATQIDRTVVNEVSPTDWDILTQGPDDEEYWDVWQHVLDNATLRENSVTYTLHQDGDLWAVPHGMYWNDHNGAFEWPPAEGDGV